MCLVSGGAYKHPQTNKVEVAAALLSGLLSPNSPEAPCLEFAYDENAFAEAFHDRGRMAQGAKSQDAAPLTSARESGELVVGVDRRPRPEDITNASSSVAPSRSVTSEELLELSKNLSRTLRHDPSVVSRADGYVRI